MLLRIVISYSYYFKLFWIFLLEGGAISISNSKSNDFIWNNSNSIEFENNIFVSNNAK